MDFHGDLDELVEQGIIQRTRLSAREHVYTINEISTIKHELVERNGEIHALWSFTDRYNNECIYDFSDKTTTFHFKGGRQVKIHPFLAKHSLFTFVYDRIDPSKLR